MAQVGATLKALLPNGGWAAQPAITPGVWLVYMGPYPDAEFYARKLSELRRIKGLNFEEVNSPPALAQGLSLGRYTSLTEAQAGLAAMGRSAPSLRARAVPGQPQSGQIRA